MVNEEHWWRLSPLDYRWRCGRSGPAYVIMVSQHAFTAICLCYLSINSFLWFFIYLLYNIIYDTKNVKLCPVVYYMYLNWKKGLASSISAIFRSRTSSSISKNNTEMRKVLDNQDNDFWLTLETYGELGRKQLVLWSGYNTLLLTATRNVWRVG